ncbi:NADH dehydrogenase 32K chain-like protein [Haloferax mucosum ATCC BAA-1512]|uniref:NADH dehydrogenase 32K chain-like protein n=1 Tax=Haloferax mucosum ATCC BAA-1512 TaxID=662479 RepID=M0IEK1_9EURY|nr:NAD(P)H-binding protein [Haloferax mucosum]ELZ95191.1 NADH dehydrogenase 32K chain-like protein [Haloferax mucosum ATCC BAA-1512]
MRVLVTGATGFVGRHLVPALLDAGHDVVVFVREAGRYDGPADVEVVEGDIFEPETVEPAMVGVDAAYYLIHSMQSGGDFEARDRLAARNFINAADAAGVERVVYLGGLGEEHDQLSAHLRSRREVEHILASSSPELTTLRAAIIVGAGSASFDMVRQLAKRLPVMVTPQWVETRCQPIAIEDVVAYLVGVLDHPETAGETYEIGGPDVLTYREMLQRVGTQLGQSPRIVPVPVLTPRLSSYWIGLVTDVETGVARPLIEGLRNPVVVTDDRIRDIVDVEETPFDIAVERALLEERDSTTVPAETPTTTP